LYRPEEEEENERRRRRRRKNDSSRLHFPVILVLLPETASSQIAG